MQHHPVQLFCKINMDALEAIKIAGDYLDQNDLKNSALIRAEFYSKGTTYPSGYTLDSDEWGLCFIHENNGDEISTDAAIVVIVDVASKKARFISSE